MEAGRGSWSWVPTVHLDFRERAAVEHFEQKFVYGVGMKAETEAELDRGISTQSCD